MSGFYINENSEIIEISNELVVNNIVYRYEMFHGERLITGEFSYYPTKDQLLLVIQ